MERYLHFRARHPKPRVKHLADFVYAQISKTSAAFAFGVRVRVHHRFWQQLVQSVHGGVLVHGERQVQPSSNVAHEGGGGCDSHHANSFKSALTMYGATDATSFQCSSSNSKSAEPPGP